MKNLIKKALIATGLIDPPEIDAVRYCNRCGEVAEYADPVDPTIPLCGRCVVIVQDERINNEPPSP